MVIGVGNAVRWLAISGFQGKKTASVPITEADEKNAAGFENIATQAAPNSE
jgi:hypothetical protein